MAKTFTQEQGGPRKPGSRSVTRTIRVDEDVEEKLLSLSDRESVSINVLANRALRRYVDYEVYAEKFGLMSVSKRLLKTLFDSLPEKKARELGRNSGRTAGLEFVTFWYKKFNLENLIKTFDDIASRYGRNFRFEHISDGGNHTLVLRHDCGSNASAYYAESIKSVFALLDEKVEVTETEEQIVAKILPSTRRQPPDSAA